MFFTTSTEKKIELTDAIPKLVNAALKTARRYHAKNASGKSFRNESEAGTQTQQA